MCLCVYRLHQFQGDLIAGTAVGLTVVPQSLAYAKIAELPPQVGVRTSLLLVVELCACVCVCVCLSVCLRIANLFLMVT